MSVLTKNSDRVCFSGTGTGVSYCGRRKAKISDQQGAANCDDCCAALRADEARFKQEADR